jgi:hypothetical protein
LFSRDNGGNGDNGDNGGNGGNGGVGLADRIHVRRLAARLPHRNLAGCARPNLRMPAGLGAGTGLGAGPGPLGKSESIT